MKITNIVLLVYDITQRRTFEYIRNLLEIIKIRSSINKISITLIGNKKDLEKK